MRHNIHILWSPGTRFYRPQGKVIFSQVSVCPQGGGGREVCVQGDLCPEGSLPRGVSVQGESVQEETVQGVSVQWGLSRGAVVSTHPTGMHSCYTFGQVREWFRSMKTIPVTSTLTLGTTLSLYWESNPGHMHNSAKCWPLNYGAHTRVRQVVKESIINQLKPPHPRLPNVHC